jgi:hypothetical protein
MNRKLVVLAMGKVLFRLYDDGWRFEKLISFNAL